jgi:hypothetical protein
MVGAGMMTIRKSPERPCKCKRSRTYRIQSEPTQVLAETTANSGPQPTFFPSGSTVCIPSMENRLWSAVSAVVRQDGSGSRRGIRGVLLFSLAVDIRRGRNGPHQPLVRVVFGNPAIVNSARALRPSRWCQRSMSTAATGGQDRWSHLKIIGKSGLCWPTTAAKSLMGSVRVAVRCAERGFRARSLMTFNTLGRKDAREATIGETEALAFYQSCNLLISLRKTGDGRGVGATFLAQPIVDVNALARALLENLGGQFWKSSVRRRTPRQDSAAAQEPVARHVRSVVGPRRADSPAAFWRAP